ncbi:hypothetical protein XO10_05895 [Marinitoga sp. 1135]|uniref:alpha-1,2-fucosyltransferase n=1 Tax=Marinitoga sp. 1135 TaxID=1643333 RepID=UPI0015865C8E|nr:alpha-1,2-fucosyltransferase [Marinitoga sp. 1135]NUU95812.1 hypothetical protein [Marinitoga sp. 1135]
MIIFFESGKLGNQIFQYTFLKTIQKNNEKIILFGFEELFNVFEINDNRIIKFSIKSKWRRRMVYKVIKPFIELFSNVNLINSIQVEYEKVLHNYRRESTKYNMKKGLIKKITLVKTGYFQSEIFFDKNLLCKLKIKEDLIKRANQFLKPIEKKYKVFVHIRRGDYKNLKVYGKSALLPMNYFHQQIKWFLENKKNVYFIFLSDEPSFIEEEFNYLDNKIISNNSYEVDFAIMTLCNGAILSPSSFGWWGSYLMKDRDVVFAPKYWLGFNSKINYHKEPLANFMIIVEI